mgnify:CR=1 FL=1
MYLPTGLILGKRDGRPLFDWLRQLPIWHRDADRGGVHLISLVNLDVYSVDSAVIHTLLKPYWDDKLLSGSFHTAGRTNRQGEALLAATVNSYIAFLLFGLKSWERTVRAVFLSAT